MFGWEDIHRYLEPILWLVEEFIMGRRPRPQIATPEDVITNRRHLAELHMQEPTHQKE